MTHITQQQRQQIADLRSKGVSFVKISQQTGIPMGTAKTIFYKDRPPSPPPTRTKTGQLKSRSSKGRKPENGKAAQSDKARAAACRARKRERLAELAGNPCDARDAELVALLTSLIGGSEIAKTKAIILELYTRHCAIS